MELEASETKQIQLRYLSASGRERKLNTKVPFADLQQASAIRIQLLHVGSRGQRS